MSHRNLPGLSDPALSRDTHDEIVHDVALLLLVQVQLGLLLNRILNSNQEADDPEVFFFLYGLKCRNNTVLPNVYKSIFKAIQMKVNITISKIRIYLMNFEKILIR